MAVRQYIGNRYVPIIYGEWTNTVAYEPLTIVTHEGNGYTSKQNVPVGVDISNTNYWVLTTNYDGNFQKLVTDVSKLQGDMTQAQTDITNLETTVSNHTKQISANTTKISTNSDDISTLTDDYNTLSAKVQTNTSDITQLQNLTSFIDADPEYLQITPTNSLAVGTDRCWAMKWGNIVQLSLCITNWTRYVTITTLPAGWRPKYTSNFMAYDSGQIESNSDFIFTVSNNGTVDLSAPNATGNAPTYLNATFIVE